jgi:hypothetical protein
MKKEFIEGVICGGITIMLCVGLWFAMLPVMGKIANTYENADKYVELQHNIERVDKEECESIYMPGGINIRKKNGHVVVTYGE